MAIANIDLGISREAGFITPADVLQEAKIIFFMYKYEFAELLSTLKISVFQLLMQVNIVLRKSSTLEYKPNTTAENAGVSTHIAHACVRIYGHASNNVCFK